MMHININGGEDEDDFLDSLDFDNLDIDYDMEYNEGIAIESVKQKATPKLNMADITPQGIDANLDYENLPVIDMAQNAASANFVQEFLTVVKEPFDLHGYAYAEFVLSYHLAFGKPKMRSIEGAFRNRLSRVRNAARAAKHHVPEFYAVFIEAHPIGADDKGNSHHWYVRLARLNETHYRDYRQLRHSNTDDEGKTTLDKSIGAL